MAEHGTGQAAAMDTRADGVADGTSGGDQSSSDGGKRLHSPPSTSSDDDTAAATGVSGKRHRPAEGQEQRTPDDSSLENQDTVANTMDDDDSREDDEKLCRYCLLGEKEQGEMGKLVAPCNCIGGQQWVHLDCLRRWQRSVLVTQPTHPAFYERDERQYVCSVCKAKFSIEPPSRAELMAGFTGPELAALLDVGCLIACEPRTSREMQAALLFNSHISHVRTLTHWIESVYLIHSVVPQENRDDDSEDQSDGIMAVNLTAPVSSIDDLPVPRVARMIQQRCPGVRLQHFLGGPCEPYLPTAFARLYHTTLDQVDAESVAVVAKSGGLWITGFPSHVAAEVRRDEARAQGQLTADTKDADTDDAKKGSETGDGGKATGGSSAADNAHADAQAVADADGSPADTRNGASDGDESDNALRPVLVFWGDARWSRTQLLGELAKGSWGMCHADVSDAFAAEPLGQQPDPKGLWTRLVTSGRLVYAPDNEMMRDDRQGDDTDDDDDGGGGEDGHPPRRRRPQTAEEADAEARAMNEQMAAHREQLRRRLLAQQQQEQQRQRKLQQEQQQQNTGQGNQPENKLKGGSANAAPERRCCSHCGTQREELKRCARCKTAMYCDRECQRAAWPAHKSICQTP
eukprot:m.19220 g.19220  ORF g.19220 m.19220 type:complete len:631 (+) comp5898_c0_seq1:395-2287(+)